MKRRTFPLWLIRDLPALIGITLSFWPLVIMVIANGAKAMRGHKISPAVYEHLMLMLPLAEAKLRHALYRQAFRAFGWNVRHVPREQLPAVTSWAEFLPRFEAYRLAMMDLREASQTFTDMLRHHYRIRTRVDANTVRAAHASTDAARCAAAQHELAGVATSSSCTSQEALMLSSARSARPSKHERGLTTARGPPGFTNNRKPSYPIPQRFRASENTSARTAHKPPSPTNKSPGRGNLPGLLQL